MTRERKRCPGQRSRWRRRLSWPRAPGEEEREREGLSPPYRSPTPPKSNVYEALSVFSHSSTCNPKGRGPCLHRAPGRERVPRQFQFCFRFLWLVGDARARCSAEGCIRRPGEQSTPPRGAVSEAAGFMLAPYPLPPTFRPPPTITSRDERSTGRAWAEHRLHEAERAVALAERLRPRPKWRRRR